MSINSLHSQQPMPHDNHHETLSFEELQRFIAASQSPVIAEKVAALVYENILEADHLQECVALFEPLIFNLRERLNERGIPDPKRVNSVGHLSRKNREMLGSLAILQLATVCGLVLMSNFSEETRERTAEAITIAKYLGEDVLEGELLIQMGVMEWGFGRREEGETLFETAYELGRKANTPDVMAAALKYHALLLKDRGEYDRAIEHLRTALSIFPAQAPRFAGQEYHVHVALARLLMETNRFEEAYDILNEARDIVRESQEIRRRIIVLEVLADWYIMTDLLPQGLETAEEALALARRNEGASLIASSLLRVGSIYLKLDNPSFAETTFQEAAEIFKEIGHVPRERRVRINIADTLAAQGEYERALGIYREILDTAPEVDNNLEGIAFLHNVVGDMLAGLGRDEEAGKHYTAALELCNEAGILRGKIRTLRSLGDFHRRQTRPDEAAACYEESLALFTGEDEGTAGSHLALSQLYKESDDPASALRHFMEYHRITNSIQERKRDNKLAALQAQHRVEWHRREAEKEKERRASIEAELQLRSLSLIEKEELLDIVRRISLQATAAMEEGNTTTALHSLNSIVQMTRKASALNTEALSRLYSIDRDFQEVLRTDHPDLTRGQIKLAALIRAGLDNGEIARMLGTNVEALMKQRYRLRKALGLSKGEELERYLGGVGRISGEGRK